MLHHPKGPSEAAPFYLTTQDGYRWPAPSLEALFRRLDDGRVSLALLDGLPYLLCPPRGRRYYGMTDLTLTDATGHPVDLRWVLPLYRQYQEHHHTVRAAHPSFRRDPVERVGRPRAGSNFRHPRTTPSLRQVAGVMTDEGEPAWRGRRKHLPTVWDDFWKPRFRSWKHYRRTQWKSE